MAAVAGLLLTFGVIDNDMPQTQGERAASIARTVRCPQCDGETVAESNAPIAIEIRAEINMRVSRGETDDQIRSFLSGLYGRDILLTPPGEGAGSSVWIIPVVGVTLAAGVLALIFWRRKFEIAETSPPTPEETEFIEKELLEKAQPGNKHT